MKVLVINGANMNLLGKREPEIYGGETLEDLEQTIRREAEKLEWETELEFFQSNHEGEIIDMIHQAMTDKTDAIILNPGAFTHYSYAIRDAIKATGIRTVEVHMSNIHTREEFRKNSVIAPVCVGQISGFGFSGYLAALYLLKRG
ncbi:MAG: type II 3-dehydroquinate dehydratase [Clostridiaceae bacterium]|jgi:3-dehydroquinate dehydratase-2|nr:type II 3-dehydroquinate dehydratase [Clostridiaceae bacterium]